MIPRARFRSFALAISTACSLVPSLAAAWSLTDGAGVHPPYRGDVPNKSDVVFSTRFERKEAPEAIKAFGATRVEWVYTDDKGYVDQLEAVAPWFGGGVRTSGKALAANMVAKNFDGQDAIVPRMAQWGGQLMTSNSPESQKYMLDTARQLVGWGAKSIHFDNPLLQYNSALFLGGDFHPATLAGFPKYLASYPDQARLASLGLKGFNGDYRDFVRKQYGIKDQADYEKRYKKLPSNAVWLDYVQDSVGQRFREFRQALNQGRPKPVPVSMNLSNLYEPSEDNRYFFLGQIADYGIAETHIDELPRLLMQMATARSMGIGVVASMRPLGLAENRAAVATLYALGSQALVPWDIYSGNDDEGRGLRYFGKPEEYGDLYRFVRANPALFDKMETVAEVGIPVPVDKFMEKPTRELVAMLAERQIPFAFVPTGGTTAKYRADVERLKRFRLLVTPNADKDFAPEDLKALQASQVQRSDPAGLRKGLLDDLQPFYAAPGSEALRIVARAQPGDPTRLVLHLVDTARATASPDAECKRRVGISKAVLDPARVVSATWWTPEGRADVQPDPASRGVFFNTKGCPLWGVMELRLKR